MHKTAASKHNPGHRSSILRSAAIAVALAVNSSFAVAESYDIVVYGGTASGVAAAVQASRMGMRVALIEPTEHLGGLTTGGLSYTDIGAHTGATGGFAADFYRRLGRSYGQTTAKYVFEPHEAEKTLEQLVSEASVTVIRGDDLSLAAGSVVKSGTQIQSITTEAGRVLQAKQFIDSSYTGDLMAKAGVSYAVGREANATYGETYNGVQKQYSTNHQFKVRVDPYVTPGVASSGLLPGISATAPGTDGSADNRVQAYNYRLIVTKDVNKKLPWTAPANYDRSQYALMGRYIQAADVTSVDSLLLIKGIAAGKYDINNNGPVSTDMIGGNYNYPEADHATRQQIAQSQKDYQQGLLYYLATDSAVPQTVRDGMNSYGLCNDEFTDNGGWSNQLYVREGRRMISDYVMIDKNILGSRQVTDSVALGDYTMDSHNTQRYVAYDANGAYVKNEGNIEKSVPNPYAISYQSITPRQSEASNLLVPVAVSASHIAYGSIRMEPVFMELGQAAATAAVQAIRNNQAVQQVDYGVLSRQLVEDGQKLSYGATSQAPRFVGTLREDFHYGPDSNRVDVVSYTTGGWSGAWGPGLSSSNGSTQLNSAAGYGVQNQLRYTAPGYTNSPDPTYLISGGAGAAGSTIAATVVGRGITGGMTGAIWISALVQIDSLTSANRDALIWLDRTEAGNSDNAGNSFIGLRTGGKAKLRYGGSTDLSADSNTFAANTVHLLLARVDIDQDGTTSDSLQFWVDPNLANLGTPLLTTSGSDIFGTSFDGLGLSVGAGGMIDALRVSNESDGFAQVTSAVPEPVAISLSALTCMLLIGRPRRMPK